MGVRWGAIWDRSGGGTNGMNDPENGRRKGGAEGYIKSNNKQQLLGTEWSMSEVGTPPPHNSEKLHGLEDSIKKKKTTNILSFQRPPFNPNITNFTVSNTKV